MSTVESTGHLPEAQLAPEAAVAAEVTPEKKAQALTSYHVMRQITPGSPGEPQRWEVHAAYVEAQSGQAAIRGSAVASEKPQTFIAVPSRSFRPVTVTVETKTQLKLT
jgi:hypothetical protein